MSRLTLRRFPATVVLTAPGYGEVRAGTGGASVRVVGDPGEVAIFVNGRQGAARVDVEGPPELARRLTEARLGV